MLSFVLLALCLIEMRLVSSPSMPLRLIVRKTYRDYRRSIVRLSSATPL
jgi:hypothetical protein